MYKNKNSKCQNFYLLIPLLTIAISIFGITYSAIYFSLLGIPIFFLWIKKSGFYHILIYALVSLAIIVLYIILKNFSCFTLVHNLIDNLFGFSIRNKITAWINKNYDQNTSSFINLIVFNVKNKNSYIVYDKMVDLSIVYMVVISGFHLSIFKYLIGKILKNKTLSNSISLGFIIFYSFLLNFSLSSIRVLFCLATRMIFKHRLTKYNILGLSGIMTAVLNPSSPLNYGFCLSYLCTCCIYLIFDWQINNFFIEKIVINILIVLISSPFALLINQQISLWAIVLGFLFTYLFCFIFVYFLLTFWMIWIAPVQQTIVFTILYIINAFYLANVVIKFNNITPILICGYYYIYFLLIIYFHKKMCRAPRQDYDSYLLRTR
jgi:competence protein ComEC